MKKKLMIISLVVLVVALILIFTLKGNSNSLENFEGEIKEFNIVAKKWDFNPETINVNKGDKVILNIESIDVAHGITLSEFGIREILQPNKKIKIEFIADKEGEFDFFCNVYCGKDHGSMRGKLIVKK